MSRVLWFHTAYISRPVSNILPSFNTSKIWVTEYNFDNQDLPTTQAFFNQSVEYMDRLPYLERYSIFAAFRSSVSNVGPNAAMLSAGGQLTDIGVWYLGRSGKGVDPSSTVSASASGVLLQGWSVLALAGASSFAAISLLL